MLSGGADKAHNLHIVLISLLRAEASGNFMLNFAETNGLLRFVIGEGNSPISYKAQDIPFIVPQPLQQAESLAFSNPSAIPLR